MDDDKRNLGILYSDARNIRRKGFNKNPDVMRASAEKVANIGFFLVLGAWVGRLVVFLLSLMGAGAIGIVANYVILGLTLMGLVAAIITLVFVRVKRDNRQMKSAVPTTVATLIMAALYFIFFHPVI